MEHIIHESIQISVDKTNKLGDTAIMLASAHGHAEAVSCLLEAGANTKLKNNDKKGLIEMSRDPEVSVVLRKWGVIAVIDRKSLAFGDDDYNDNDEDEDQSKRRPDIIFIKYFC